MVFVPNVRGGGGPVGFGLTVIEMVSNTLVPTFGSNFTT